VGKGGGGQGKNEGMEKGIVNYLKSRRGGEERKGKKNI